MARDGGTDIPLATCGLMHPVWAVAAMADCVTLIYVHSLSGRSSLLLAGISSTGRQPVGEPARAAVTVAP